MQRNDEFGNFSVLARHQDGPNNDQSKHGLQGKESMGAQHNRKKQAPVTNRVQCVIGSQDRDGPDILFWHLMCQ